MMLTPDEVKAITGRLIAGSRADACIVHVDGGDRQNLRFARNSATSNGALSQVSVSITSEFGQRAGSTSTTSLDADTLDKAQRRSEDIARAAPANPEHLPPLGPQSYAAGIAFDDATAALPPSALGEAARSAITEARARGIHAAGYAETGATFLAVATSNGLFAYDRSTIADLTVTARRPDGRWSGWAGGSEFRIGELTPGDIAGRAVGKAAHEATPLDLEPGQYTVVLEPSAVGEMLRFMLWNMDARDADEGRSWLSKKGGGNRLGETLFDARVTLVSDPAEKLAPVSIYGREGLPQHRAAWFENGVLKNLAYSRFWADKTGNAPRPSPSGVVMSGGPTPIEEMIRSVSRGILVTRVWYANMLDPRTLLLTGLTRDGNFLIENGKIAGPVRNFRFNESLVAMLGNIDAIGPTARIHGGDLGGGPVAAPPLLVKTFNFASRSSGI